MDPSATVTREGFSPYTSVHTSATRTPSLKSLAMFRFGLESLISSTQVYSLVRSSLLSVSVGITEKNIVCVVRDSRTNLRRPWISTEFARHSWGADFL